MAKLVIDASVFLSSLFSNEVNSKISAEFLKFVQEKNILIIMPILTLFEVLHGFQRLKKDRELTELLHQNFIDMNRSKGLLVLNLEAEFLAYFFTNHQSFDLKTSDTIVALTAQKENCPLISWDKKLLKQASQLGPAYTPKDYLEA